MAALDLDVGLLDDAGRNPAAPVEAAGGPGLVEMTDTPVEPSDAFPVAPSAADAAPVPATRESIGGRVDGLAFTPPARWTFEDFEHDLGVLLDVAAWTPWALGDVMVAGEQRFGDDCYQAVPDGLGLRVETLRKYARIAERIPARMRIRELSFSHHARVAGVEDIAERQAWLVRARDEGWSHRELVAKLRDARSLPAHVSSEGPAVTCPNCGHPLPAATE